MRIEDIAENVDLDYISDEDLIPIVNELKRQFKVSSNALKRKDWGKESYSPLSKTERIIDSHKNIFNMNNAQLLENPNALRFAYKTYLGYFGKYSPNGDFERYKTSTVSGYKEVLKKQKDVTGIKGYSNWNKEEQNALWDVISRMKELGPEFFISKGVRSDYLYSSDWTIKQISTYIDDVYGKDYIDHADPVELMGILEENISIYSSGREMPRNIFLGE